MFLLNISVICITWLEKCNAISMKTISFEIKLTAKSMLVTSGTLVENPDNVCVCELVCRITKKLDLETSYLNML